MNTLALLNVNIFEHKRKHYQAIRVNIPIFPDYPWNLPLT